MIRPLPFLAALVAIGALTLGACSSGNANDGQVVPVAPTTEAAAPQTTAPEAEPTVEEPVAEEATVPVETLANDGGDNAGLQRIVDAAQPQIPGIMQQFGELYADIRILAEHPDTIAYEYDYAEELDAAATAAELERLRGDLVTAATTYVFPEMANAGVTPVQKARYTYFQPDGSLIWTTLITSDEG